MKGQNVVFKGTRNGVIITINSPGSFEDIKDEIEEKFVKSSGFFRNGKVYMDFSGVNIDETHQEEIMQMVSNNYGVLIQDIDKDRVRVFNGINEGRTKFIKSTIRSGQSIEYPGNVVIIGDINAGGEVKAGGNIIVMGTLRGMVHAGTSGNERAIIAAFSLQPTQLRIAGIISRAPDGEILKPKCPELARIKDGYIIIEPYIPNKQL